LFQCFTLVEDYEEDIEEWYYGDQKQPLIDFLCRDRFLKNKDAGRFIRDLSA